MGLGSEGVMKSVEFFILWALRYSFKKESCGQHISETNNDAIDLIEPLNSASNSTSENMKKGWGWKKSKG